MVLALGLLAATADAEAKYASVVMNADTDEILHETNADTRNYPASLTKMMTLYLVFEALDQGRLSLDDTITFSAHAARQPASKLGLPAGKSITVGTAIEALAIKSANDVASAMAEHLGKTEVKFALKMTATARRLGMSNTTFRNASGLPHRAQMSTARDIATLAQALIRDFPKHYEVFSKRTFTYQGKSYRNTNKLLTSYKGVDGIKTGYIRASGFNLVTSVKRNGVRLIGVVFGGRTSKARNYTMARLLNDGYDVLNTQQIALNVSAPPRKPETIPVRLKMAQAEATPAKITPAKPNTPVKATPARLMDTWGIQVGAYKTYDPALEMAKKVASFAQEILAHGQVAVVPLDKKNGSKLFRARILGLNKSEAYSACRAVKRKKIGCMELRMKQPDEVASAG